MIGPVSEKTTALAAQCNDHVIQDRQTFDHCASCCCSLSPPLGYRSSLQGDIMPPRRLSVSVEIPVPPKSPHKQQPNNESPSISKNKGAGMPPPGKKRKRTHVWEDEEVRWDHLPAKRASRLGPQHLQPVLESHRHRNRHVHPR
ncbi:hypothetical protein AG1IA_10005 [Rhizoctonia solani AG-1 IA]|uniref:Uncharacterized protein n=1 Tax=Thanatephorus cucumeris (strain AG1-IA) TaxID=983506 RepID=L8WDC5_THACA|nr:hypothetical protein AG1IA_10005 [Rhizoctonia solani AG-1 IA]